jgi:predicted phosphodiesterase
LTLANVPLVLMHGHNGLVNYVRDKFLYIRDGYKFERYQKKLVKLAPEARVIVFGHTHRVVNKVIDGQLWFNPGSAGFSFREDALPTIGVLRFYDKGKVRGEVLKLDGFRLQKGLWEAVSSS